jgi:hypothetical protein
MTGTSVTKPKPWNVKAGLGLGLVVGIVLWFGAYDPDGGLMQNLRLLVVPTALGAGFVGLRNWHKQVGPFDPEIIAENKRGRV